MLFNKALWNKLDANDKRQAMFNLEDSVNWKQHFTLFGKKTGVILSTYNTLEEARQEIRTWSAYPFCTSETVKYNRILRTLGIKI